MKTFDQLILEENSKERLLYFDTEFTGLHQETTLISIGCITEEGRTFYAELTDYDSSQVNDWLKENVFTNLKYISLEGNVESFVRKDVNEYVVVGDKEYVKNAFWEWIKMIKYKSIRMYSDCLSYDWVLFNTYFADNKNGMNDLKNIHYIPLDLCTDLYRSKIDPDINREEFSEYKEEIEKHNALFDAKIIKACYEKININNG